MENKLEITGQAESGDQKNGKWGIGELRRAVLKENAHKEYNDPITYAPDGRVIVLENESGEFVEPGDIVEVFITEEKPRSYYGQIMTVVKKYDEVKQLAAERGELFEQELERYILNEKACLDVKEGLESFKNVLMDVGSRMETLEKRVSADEPESGEEEQDTGQVVAVVEEEGDTYVLRFRDAGVVRSLGEATDAVRFDIFLSQEEGAAPLVMREMPQEDGSVRIPGALKRNFSDAFEKEREVVVEVDV